MSKVQDAVAGVYGEDAVEEIQAGPVVEETIEGDDRTVTAEDQDFPEDSKAAKPFEPVKVFAAMNGRSEYIIVDECGEKLASGPCKEDDVEDAKAICMSEVIANLLHEKFSGQYTLIWVDEPGANAEYIEACRKMENMNR